MIVKVTAMNAPLMWDALVEPVVLLGRCPSGQSAMHFTNKALTGKLSNQECLNQWLSISVVLMIPNMLCFAGVGLVDRM